MKAERLHLFYVDTAYTIFELTNEHTLANTGRICWMNVLVWLKNTETAWVPSFSFFLSLFYLHSEANLFANQVHGSHLSKAQYLFCTRKVLLHDLAAAGAKKANKYEKEV